MRFLSTLITVCLAALVSGCVTFAAPPPLVTAGGPTTVERGHSEVALGLGTGVALFEQQHSGGNAWLGRLRYGLTDRIDIGGDMMGANHGDTGTFNFKVAGRYQLAERARFELGLGAADNSDGKSLSTELALTVGNTNAERFWNPYVSIRAAAAKGYSENFLGLGPGRDLEAPPDALFGLVNLGTTARISENQKFFFESGLGYIFAQGEPAAPMIFWGAGVQFVIGN